MINGETKKLGIIGWPVAHSASPMMHNAAFAHYELNWVYLPLPVSTDRISQAVESLKTLGFSGANVTIPHKVSIMSYLDELSLGAKLAGAVNTICIEDGKAIGHNTDMYGFVKALKNEGFCIKGKKAAIFGAGGAARAIVAGLIQGEIEEVYIGARNEEQAKRVLSEIKDQLCEEKPLQMCCSHWENKIWQEYLCQCDLIVNTTPLGMKPYQDMLPPIPWSELRGNTVICDIVYTPQKTRLLIEAGKNLHKTVNGIGMLIEQGREAFRLWTGIEPSHDVMYDVLYKFFSK